MCIGYGIIISISLSLSLFPHLRPPFPPSPYIDFALGIVTDLCEGIWDGRDGRRRLDNDVFKIEHRLSLFQWKIFYLWTTIKPQYVRILLHGISTILWDRNPRL